MNGDVREVFKRSLIAVSFYRWEDDKYSEKALAICREIFTKVNSVRMKWAGLNESIAEEDSGIKELIRLGV